VSKTLAELEEKILPLAIAAGAGLPVSEITSHCDVALQTYYNRLSDPDSKSYFEKWKGFTAGVLEKEIARRVQKVESAQSAEQRVSAIFARALTVSERMLSRVENAGDEAEMDDLRRIHKDFTKFFAPWAASQAPKRIEMGGNVTHTHVLVDETVNRVVAFEKKYAEMGYLPPAAEEAELVS
jgi:hypothetical protein